MRFRIVEGALGRHRNYSHVGLKVGRNIDDLGEDRKTVAQLLSSGDIQSRKASRRKGTYHWSRLRPRLRPFPVS